MRRSWYSRTRWARRFEMWRDSGARRCASASASCATTTAATEAPPSRPVPTPWRTSAGTSWRSWTASERGASPSAASRSGGWSACGSPAKRPKRVERLVLCCTAASFDPDAYSSRARTVRETGVAEVADAVLERWFTPAFREGHPGVFEWAGRMLRDTPPEGYAGCCEAISVADLAGQAWRHPRPHA